VLPKESERTGTDVNITGIGNIVSGSKVRGTWIEQEKTKSSTWRELQAIYRVLCHNKTCLQNKTVKALSDNKNVQYIINSGSSNMELHNTALAIYELCHSANIKLFIDWIPRRQNDVADHLSRCLDADDWSISDDVFSFLDNQWGPHTVDRFSSHYNNKCKRFNCRWWVPGAEAVDALAQTWIGENNWLVPPPRLATDCLKKLQYENSTATLVVPEWKSAPFWPLIVDENGMFKDFIKMFYYLPVTGSIVKGKGNNGVFSSEPLSFRMLTLRIQFT
jgi:hypothetical protein